MKLYYDMLIPYMPDSTANDSGELVKDEAKVAGRRALEALSNFQNSGNILALYQSVIDACIYAQVDLVDTICNIPEDITFTAGTPIDDILDEAALSLFKSIKPDIGFDVNKFTANVLTAVHTILESQRKEIPTPPPAE